MESSVHNEISVLPGSEKALASRITVWKEFAQLATSELKKMGKNRVKRETAELDADLRAKADGILPHVWLPSGNSGMPSTLGQKAPRTSQTRMLRLVHWHPKLRLSPFLKFKEVMTI